MEEQTQTFLGAWQDRLTALRNVPPVLKIVWESGKGVVAVGIAARLVASLIPVAVLNIASTIVGIVASIANDHKPTPSHFWWLVAAEFGLALLGAIAARVISYYDTLLADRYSRHVSILVLEHASQLDLATYRILPITTAWNGRECRPPIAW